MSKLTKNQKSVADKVEAGKAYTLKEASELVKEITTIGGLFVMPEIDFLNKKTFTKTSGMINLRKRATIESP